jgi:hypothetical protein
MPLDHRFVELSGSILQEDSDVNKTDIHVNAGLYCTGIADHALRYPMSELMFRHIDLPTHIHECEWESGKTYPPPQIPHTNLKLSFGGEPGVCKVS